MDIFQSIAKYRSISIIGMEKNVGKTTVLNRIISESKGKLTLALTTIGRDGEEKDLVTATHKPRIYVYRGTIIATATQTLLNSDITREILMTTEYSTPMGNIIIIRALSDGYVDIAGPSFNSQIKIVSDKMRDFGADLVIVDGAISRKQSASTGITEGTILVTGAAYNPDMKIVVDETKRYVDFFSLPQFSHQDREEYKSTLEKCSGLVLYSDGSKEMLNGVFFLEDNQKVKDILSKGVSKIFLNGACTDNSLKLFIDNRGKFKDLEIVVQDGTKLFISSSVLKRASLSNIRFSVLNKINLLFVTYNHTSPFGYTFDKSNFAKALRGAIDRDIIDVMED